MAIPMVIPVVEKGLDVLTKLLDFFSSDERKKGWRLKLDKNLKKAISTQREHYDYLLDNDGFLDFVDKYIVLEEKHTMKRYNKMKIEIKEHRKRFKRYT